MKRLEKKSTEENIKTTLIDNTIKRNEDLAQITIIVNSYVFTIKAIW
ncbi:MAG: hypothetical protein IKU06_03170 [Lachnospiraceae bacterium]|nr:hypothetical protein [Lachnospiraceae bacterium]